MSTTRALGGLLLAILTCAAVACGSDAAPDPAAAELPFALGLTTSAPDVLTVPLDGKASATIEVTGAGGRTVELTAENVPSEVRVIFTPQATTAASTVIVTTSTKALTGFAPIVLRAREGTRSASTVLGIEVSAAKPSVAVTLAPKQGTVRLGSSVGVAVNVDRSAGTRSDVDVQIEGLPSGLTATPITIPAAATSGVVTVAASALAPAGTSVTLSVVARAGMLEQKAPLVLDVVANAGDLDLSFGKYGVVYQPGYGTMQQGSSLFLASGNLLVTGSSPTSDGLSHVSLLRFLPTGLADSAFGVGGVVGFEVPGRHLVVNDTLETPLSKVVLAGSSFVDGTDLVTFASLNSNGSVYATFGSNGVLVWPGAVGRAQSVVWTGGQLLAVVPPADGVPANRLLRFARQGIPDATFGVDGVKPLGVPASEFIPARLLEVDGKVIVAGSSPGAFGTSQGDMVLVQLDANGDVDPAFGTAGRVVIDFGLQDVAMAVARQKDGKLVVAGTAGQYQSGRGCAVARIGADGVLDASFGNGGKALVGTTNLSECYGVTVQPDGKILAFGKTGAPDESAAVFRLDANGVLDATFHGGRSTASFGGNSEWFSAGRVLPNGRLLTAGATFEPIAGVGLARFWL